VEELDAEKELTAVGVESTLLDDGALTEPKGERVSGTVALDESVELLVAVGDAFELRVPVALAETDTAALVDAHGELEAGGLKEGASDCCALSDAQEDGETAGDRESAEDAVGASDTEPELEERLVEDAELEATEEGETDLAAEREGEAVTRGDKLLVLDPRTEPEPFADALEEPHAEAGALAVDENEGALLTLAEADTLAQPDDVTEDEIDGEDVTVALAKDEGDCEPTTVPLVVAEVRDVGDTEERAERLEEIEGEEVEESEEALEALAVFVGDEEREPVPDTVRSTEALLLGDEEEEVDEESDCAAEADFEAVSVTEASGVRVGVVLAVLESEGTDETEDVELSQADAEW
jgi:hypothetical protein